MSCAAESPIYFGRGDMLFHRDQTVRARRHRVNPAAHKELGQFRMIAWRPATSRDGDSAADKSRLLWPQVQAGDASIDDGAAILDDADHDTHALDGGDHFALEGAIAIHVRRRN